jgi:hypothetical protein
MFVVSEAEADAIRAAFVQRGELSAAIELRRLFPAITDNVQALAPLPAENRCLPKSSCARRAYGRVAGQR